MLAECFASTFDLSCFNSTVNGKFGLFLMKSRLGFSFLLSSISCNSMLCSGCSALRRVNSNLKKQNVK